MAKTDLTRDIEKALRYYAPRELGGISINMFRGRSTAFEVPVECGTNTAGMIDCVRINEYFGDKESVRACRCHTWKRDGIRRIPINCPKGIADSEKTPELCDITSCRWNIVKELGRPKILVQCFEIKVTRADFRSKNGHNFVGNLNYYVAPAEIYDSIKDDVPEDIGIILYKTGSLRRKKDATFKSMTDEDQKWMILNVLKRTRRE